MKLKEKRPAPSLSVFATFQKCPFTAKWIGVYQSPNVGVRFVRHSTGEFIRFETKDEAELAAWRALGRDESKRDPIRVTKEVVPAKRRARWSS